MEIDRLSTSTGTHTQTHPLPRSYTSMHSNLHLKFSIGTEVSIPQANAPFTLKAWLYQEGYIETCEWLLNIPAEKLTVNRKGNMSFSVSIDSQCKNELHSAPRTLRPNTDVQLLRPFKPVQIPMQTLCVWTWNWSCLHTVKYKCIMQRTSLNLNTLISLLKSNQNLVVVLIIQI